MQKYQEGTELCGRFVLRQRIGTGGHADVWRATDLETRHDIALKVLHPSLVHSPDAWRALRREHEVAQRLSHPRVAEVGEPIRDETAVVLPMALAHGDLRRLRGESYTRIVPLAIELAGALAHAHERGVVHRDLKPSNILIDEDGHISIADFGVASLDGEAPGAGLGSPFAASPQQLRGERPVPADDMYALGSLLYELLSGYPPYYPDFDAKRALQEPVPDLLSIQPMPPRLGTLILRMLATDPLERPQSMSEVQEELGAALLDTLSIGPEAAPEPAADSTLPSPDAAAPEPVVVAMAHDLTPPPSSPGAQPTTVGPMEVVEPAVNVAAPAAASSPPVPRRAWGTAAAVAVLGAAVVAFLYFLPRFAPQAALSVSGQTTLPPPSVAEVEAAKTAALETLRGEVEQLQSRFATRLASLESRAAAVWGGPLFAAAKALGADSQAAMRAQQLELAKDRIETASRRLERVESEAAAVLESQLSEAAAALQAGNTAQARQAYELALRIDPENAAARAGLQRAGGLDELLPVLTAADNAANARDFARAIQLYQEVLKSDPENLSARGGLARVSAAAGGDAYAREIGAAFEALRTDRLDAAESALARAVQLRPAGAEVVAVRSELGSLRSARDLGASRQRATDFESGERWSEALAEYQLLLQQDASLGFARAGVARTTPRAELAARLQGLIDEPARLVAAEVRDEARALIARAAAIDPSGPVLRSQLARLGLLLPTFEQPVKVRIDSDGLTRIVVQRMGDFGEFVNKEIELQPGRYTLIGTRPGFRDVRREINVTPVAEPMVVDLRCVEPI